MSNQASNFLAGMTAVDCASGCGPDRCVISGIGCCGHPNMGGLQDAIGKRDVEALARFQEARAMLAGLKVTVDGDGRLIEARLNPEAVAP